MNSGAQVSIPWNVSDGGADAFEPAVACIAGSDPWVARAESDVPPHRTATTVCGPPGFRTVPCPALQF